MLLNERMMRNRVPVWSGLYFTKTFPSEPIIYRGHGNSYFTNWKLGENVWVDGLPMGCTMIHRDILQVMYEEFPFPKDFVLPSKEFHANLLEEIEKTSSNCIVITANPGVGKSTYLSYLHEELNQKGPGSGIRSTEDRRSRRIWLFRFTGFKSIKGRRNRNCFNKS